MSREELNEDFAPEDRGRYRHPEIVAGRPYTELEALVLKAIDDDRGKNDSSGVRTYPRIKDYLSVSRADDISELMIGMELDKKIRKESNGTITAFFRYDTMPSRFWLEGDGTVGAEFIEDFVPSKPRTIQDENEEYRQRQLVSRQRAAEGFPTKGRAPIELTEHDVETAAREHGKKPAVAKALNLGYSTLLQKFIAMPALEAAYHRGLEGWKAAHPNTSPERANQTPAKEDETMTATTATAMAPATEPMARTPENIEQLAARYGNRKAVGHAVGFRGEHAGIAFSKVLNQNADFKAAYKRGVAIYEAAHPNAKEVRNDESKNDGAAATRAIDLPDLDRVEQLAADGLSVSKAARELGIVIGTFDGYVKGRGKEKRVKEAWNRGILRRDPDAKKPTPSTRKAKGPRKNVRTAAPARSDAAPEFNSVSEQPAQIETQAHEETPAPAQDLLAGATYSGNCVACGAVVDITDAPFEPHTCVACGENAVFADEPKPLEEMRPALEGQIERLKSENHGTFAAAASANEKPSNPFAATLAKALKLGTEQMRITDKIHIDFSNDAQLLVAFEGNMFTLDADEREFVRHVTDLMQSFNAGENAPAMVARRGKLRRILDVLRS